MNPEKLNLCVLLVARDALLFKYCLSFDPDYLAAHVYLNPKADKQIAQST